VVGRKNDPSSLIRQTTRAEYAAAYRSHARERQAVFPGQLEKSSAFEAFFLSTVAHGETGLTPICGGGSNMPEFDGAGPVALKGLQTQSVLQLCQIYAAIRLWPAVCKIILKTALRHDDWKRPRQTEEVDEGLIGFLRPGWPKYGARRHHERVSMEIAHFAISCTIGQYAPWYIDWVWGIPLVLLTVTTHVLGLSVVSSEKLLLAYSEFIKRHPYTAFTVVMGLTTLAAIGLHGLEAAVWAYAYCLTGALPDFKSGMLYSLNAMTAYGHEDLSLQTDWHLLGAIEALNGLLLFGLSTAVLFAMIQKLSFHGRDRS
jgi:hypothetical protein